MRFYFHLKKKQGDIVQVEKIPSVRSNIFNWDFFFRPKMTDPKIIEWLNTDLMDQLLNRQQKSINLITPEINEVDPAWDVIEETLRDVKKNKHYYDFHHFCILSYIESPMNYIQTVYHRSAGEWILEFRELFHDGGYVHYKARLKSYPEYRRFVDFRTVISAFNAFYYGSSWPDNFVWEKFNI